MTRSRRIMFQAGLVVALGAVALARAPKAEARSMSCDLNMCIEDCSWPFPEWCFNCGAGISTQCQYDSNCWFNEGKPYRTFCGYET